MTSLSTAARLKRSAMGDDMCCSCLKLGDLGASGLWGGEGAGDCQPADSSNTACDAVALTLLCFAISPVCRYAALVCIKIWPLVRSTDVWHCTQVVLCVGVTASEMRT